MGEAVTNFTPPFPPAPWPTHSWPDMTIAQRKAWYATRHKAFFNAWAKCERIASHVATLKLLRKGHG